MATSYSNSGGNASNRRYLILVTSNMGWGGQPRFLVDDGASAWWSSGANSGSWVSFNFGQPRVINESTWTQSNTVGHGTWQWQGSNDNSSWTDIGGSFTLGGATTTVMTSLNGNTTAYQWYRLAGVSGSHSSNPDVAPITFKIDTPSTSVPEYGSTYGTGDRTAIITVTCSQSSGHNNIFNGRYGSQDPFMYLLVDDLNRIDGSGPGALYLGNGGSGVDAVSGKWILFALSTAQVIDEFRWFQQDGSTHGVWQFQGSNDGISFTDIGPTFTLGGSYDGLYGYSVVTAPHGNTTAYTYYRLLGVSGNMNANPFVFEIAFRAMAQAGLSGIFSATADSLLAFTPQLYGYFGAAADPRLTITLPNALFALYIATASALASFTPGMMAFTAYPLATFKAIANAYTQMGFIASAYPQLHFDKVLRAAGFLMTGSPRLTWFTKVGQSGRCVSGPGVGDRAGGIPANYVF